MAFREYKIGARMFGLALGASMFITLYMPAVDMASVTVTKTGLEKQLSYGRVGGFSYEDPLLQGWAKPVQVLIDKDPRNGFPVTAVTAYVYQAGVPFPNGIRHPRILGDGPKKLSLERGRIGDANVEQGAVFLIRTANGVPYIENVTATRGWMPDSVLSMAGDENRMYVGAGKIMFIREGCWWCHTLLPEQTQDWQYFGAPPMLGDFNGESPTVFGSDRKAPDLTHIASRNSSVEWMALHFFQPRLVQPHSIMPPFNYLWGEKDAEGQQIDYASWEVAYQEYKEGRRIVPPEVPSYAEDSDIRYLIDFIMNLK